MSADDSGQSGGPGGREVAYRVFAAEFADADYSYSESDEERAPNYVVTPTGARVNRLFVVGVLTEVESVSDDVVRARVVDPTGAFYVYAGQYQPDALAFFERANTPAFVAITGKARTFQPEDSEEVYTSIRPESASEVDADTRDRWIVRTADQTLARASAMAAALDRPERGDDLRDALVADGVDPGRASGIAVAIDHYGTTRAYLAEVWSLAIDAARVVAGEIDPDEVGPVRVAPGETGDVEVDVDFDYDSETVAAVSETVDAGDAGAGADVGTGEAGDAPAETGDAATEEAIEADVEEAVDDEATADADASAAEVRDADDADAFQESIGDDEEPDVAPEQETVSDEEFDVASGSEDDEDLGTGDVGDEMYELDDDEREEIEDEYGVEFTSGTDIPDAGETDIEPETDAVDDAAVETDEAESMAEDEEMGSDVTTVGTDEPEAAQDEDDEPTVDYATSEADVPGPGDAAAESEGVAAAEADVTGDDEAESGDVEVDTEADGEETETPAEDVDLVDVVLDRMREMSDGGGVDRDELVDRVVEDTGASADDVDDAIQDALMDGQCYESGDDELTPI